MSKIMAAMEKMSVTRKGISLPIAETAAHKVYYTGLMATQGLICLGIALVIINHYVKTKPIKQINENYFD